MPATAAESRLSNRFTELSRSDAVALIDENGTATFAQTGERVRALATQLVTRGLGGTCIGLLAAPDRDWVEGFWAILAAGSTPLPLSPLHPAREHAFFLNHGGAQAVLLGRAFASAPVEHPLQLVFAGGRLEPR